MPMGSGKATNEILDVFVRVVNKHNGLEKLPVKHSPGIGLYNFEQHMIDRVAVNAHLILKN